MKKENSSHQEVLHLALKKFNADELIQAEQLYLQVLKQFPQHHYSLYMLGLTDRKMGKIETAEAYILRAIEINSAIYDYHYDLGNIRRDLGDNAAALVSYKNVTLLKPGYVDGHFKLASVYQDLGKLDEAIDSYQRVLSLRPDYASAHNNLANVLVEQGKLEAAILSFNAALQYKPEFALALYNLGNVYKKQGSYKKAIEFYNRAIEQDADFSAAYNGLIFVMCQSETANASNIYQQCKLFANKFESTVEYLPLNNNTEVNRRLKVAYVSGDFKQHAVANYILPILVNHDRKKFEIFCYYNHSCVDVYTKKLMQHTEHWISVVSLSDDQLAERIQRDEIDILVDLSGHTLNNRLKMFAKKPAPIQVTWFGIPITTGLSSMDYRLTDKYMDPVGMTEQFHSEKLVRLLSSNCFEPVSKLPSVNALPALSNGYVSFGCFNDFQKVNEVVITCWAKILSNLPKSRLLMVCPKHTHDQLKASFESLSVNKDQLKLIEKVPVSEYLKLHQEIDIALDTFPYTGGTTTRYALWMGVPTVTLAGQIPVSRVGFALMHHLGLEEYVANNEDEYVKIALEKAKDIESLSRLRIDLRQKVKQAPFSNSKAFTKELEDSYRTMWHKWCETKDEVR